MTYKISKTLQAKYDIWKPFYYNIDRYGYAGMVMTIGATRKGNVIYATTQDYQASAARHGYITKYDGQTWSNLVKLPDTNMTSSGDISNDGHGGTSIVRSADGHLHVFYGCHDSTLSYAYSDNADDISTWTHADSRTSHSTRALKCSYPIPFIAPDTGMMALIFRNTIAGTHYTLGVMTSTDNGLTWSTRTDFYDDTHPTYDVGGSNYWWPYHVAGIQQQVSSISGLGWCVEYNWNARTQFNSPYRREHHYYARFRFADQEWYDINGTQRSTNHTFSTAVADANFRMLSTSGTWCVGSIITTERGIPLEVYCYDSTSMLSREYVNGSWSFPATISSVIAPRTPDSSNMLIMEYSGKTYCVCDPFAYNTASNSTGSTYNRISVFEYNWRAHRWNEIAPLMVGQQAPMWTASAFVRYPQWCGTVPGEGPLINWQDVGYANGNRGYVSAINKMGAMEVVASGTNLDRSYGINVNNVGIDYTIEYSNGQYYAINAATAKIDYRDSNFQTVINSVLSSLPNGCGTIAQPAGLYGGTEIRTYKNGMQIGISANYLSSPFAIDAVTSSLLVNVTHSLPYTPPREAVDINLIENTNADDWFAMARVVSTDENCIYCKVRILSASAVSGATALLGLKVDIR